MGSIYNTPNWDSAGGTSYVKYDVATNSGKVWYCILANSSTVAPAHGSTLWNGNMDVTIDGSTSVEPYFFWSPSYNISTSHSPRIKAIQFGDGYEQRLKDGINNNN